MYIVAYFVDVELDLEYRVGIVKEFGIKSKVHVQSLSYISDIPFWVSHYVLLFVYFEFCLGGIHIHESLRLLYETDKLNSISQLGINLYNQVYLLEIALFTFSEELSLDVYHCLSGCLEVSVNEVIMHLSNRSRHDHVDIFVDEIFALESQNILNFIVDMHYGAYFSWGGRHHNNGGAGVFTESSLLIVWHLRWLLIYLVLIYADSFLHAYYRIIIIVYDVQQEGTVAVQKLNFVRVYLLKFAGNLLNLLVELRYFMSSFLQYGCIDMLLHQFPPEGLSSIDSDILKHLVAKEVLFVLEYLNDIDLT